MRRLNMSNNKYASFEQSLILKEKGFNWLCDSGYYNNYRVRDEILTKYPGLSDSGYLDLLCEYGGKYTRKEVYGYYKEVIKKKSNNAWSFCDNLICARPTLSQVQDWLRHNDIILLVEVENIDNTPQYGFSIYNIIGDRIWRRNGYKGYYEALFDGVDEVLTARNKCFYSVTLNLISKIDLSQYVGTWYEIARFDSSFECDMKKVKAEYTLLSDNTIQIINSGYIGEEYRQKIGKARITDSTRLLRVSFDDIIYSDYNILWIDEFYRFALVGGNSKDFLWILSRTPKIQNNVLTYIITKAKELGYDTSRLVFTEQN